MSPVVAEQSWAANSQGGVAWQGCDTIATPPPPPPTMWETGAKIKENFISTNWCRLIL